MSDGISYKDFPLDEIAEACGKHLARGLHFHQKFTCEKCRSRQTIETPDQLFAKGQCEACGHVTDLYVHGCNYLLTTHL